MFVDLTVKAFEYFLTPEPEMPALPAMASGHSISRCAYLPQQ